MLERDKNTESLIFLLYFATSTGMLIFYPFWIAIEEKIFRLAFFAGMLALVIASNFILANKLKIYKEEEVYYKRFKLKEHKELAALILITLAAQFIFLFLPITSYSDEISHISTGMYLEK